MTKYTAKMVHNDLEQVIRTTNCHARFAVLF